MKLSRPPGAGPPAPRAIMFPTGWKRRRRGARRPRCEVVTTVWHLTVLTVEQRHQKGASHRCPQCAGGEGCPRGSSRWRKEGDHRVEVELQEEVLRQGRSQVLLRYQVNMMMWYTSSLLHRSGLLLGRGSTRSKGSTEFRQSTSGACSNTAWRCGWECWEQCG